MIPNRSSQILLFAFVCLLIFAPKPSQAAGNEPASETRKIKVRVNPSYPDIARLMNLSGNVNLVVTVAPDGSVKECRPVGGHPILIEAATNAVKKWRYEPAAQSSTISVMLKFDRGQ